MQELFWSLSQIGVHQCQLVNVTTQKQLHFTEIRFLLWLKVDLGAWKPQMQKITNQAAYQEVHQRTIPDPCKIFHSNNINIYIFENLLKIFRSDSKTNRNLYNSSSIDGDKYASYSDDQASGGYQNFKDQKEAFFSKKQLENCTRPE